MKDNKNNLFIHLNLCIALALGIVVFIGGIENATITEVPMHVFYENLLIIGYEFNLYTGKLQGGSSTFTVFFHICFLLDAV